MTTHWLDLDFTSSRFYEYSKEEKDEYEKHTSSTGKISYRKFYSTGVFGILQSVDILDTNFGQRLTVRVMKGDDIYVMKFPLMNEKGNFDNRYGEPVICLLPNLSKGVAYRFFPYNMEGTPKEGQTARTFYGVSVKIADLDNLTVSDKVEPKFVRGKRDEPVAANHIPAVVFKEKLGKFVPTAVSLEAKEEFLEKILVDEVARLGYDKSKSNSNSTETNTEAPKQTPTDTSTAKKVNPAAKRIDTTVDDDDDDLPF